MQDKNDNFENLWWTKFYWVFCTELGHLINRSCVIQRGTYMLIRRCSYRQHECMTKVQSTTRYWNSPRLTLTWVGTTGGSHSALSRWWAVRVLFQRWFTNTKIWQHHYSSRSSEHEFTTYSSSSTDECDKNISESLTFSFFLFSSSSSPHLLSPSYFFLLISFSISVLLMRPPRFLTVLHHALDHIHTHPNS